MKFNFLEKFINKKSEKNKNIINRNNLYIFPNQKGFQVGALIFFCFAVSIFYQNNFALLLSIILFFIFFISILISYQNLNNLKFKLLDNLFPSNQEIDLKYLVETKNKQERLNVDFYQNHHQFNTNINQSEQINFKHAFKERGVVNTPCLNISSVFPFGIIKTFGKITFIEKIVVYPKPIRPPKFILDNINNKNQEGFDYEFDKIEEDKFNKNLSKVSWKHYSIKKKYYFKKFIFKKDSENIIIDIEKLSDNLEKSLSYASYLINHFYKLKNPFAVKYKNYTSNMSCSHEHKKKQLTFLANV